METAVIDRFKEGIAVLLVGDERRPVDIPRDRLPWGAREGMWLQLTLDEGTITHAALDEDATRAAQARIQEKLARLRRGEHLTNTDENH